MLFKKDNFLLRHAELLKLTKPLFRATAQGANDAAIKEEGWELARSHHRQPEKRAAGCCRIDHPDQIETCLFDRQIDDLGDLVRAEQDDSLPTRRCHLPQTLLEHLANLPVEIERVIEIFIGQTGLLSDSLRRDQVSDAITLEVDDLHVTLLDQSPDHQ